MARIGFVHSIGKLDVANRTEVAVRARELNLLD